MKDELSGVGQKRTCLLTRRVVFKQRREAIQNTDPIGVALDPQEMRCVVPDEKARSVIGNAAVNQRVTRVEGAGHLDLDREISLHLTQDARSVQVLPDGPRAQVVIDTWNCNRQRVPFSLNGTIAEAISHLAPASNLRCRAGDL